MSSSVSFKSTFVASLLAGAAAAVVNAIIFFAGQAAGQFPETVIIPNAGQPLTIVPVLISSIIPSIFAGFVFFLLSKYSGKPKMIYNIIAVILLVASFANPFMMIPGVPMGMGILMNVMHVTVAFATMYFFKTLKK